MALLQSMLKPQRSRRGGGIKSWLKGCFKTIYSPSRGTTRHIGFATTVMVMLSCLQNSAVGLGVCCGNFLAIKLVFCFFILQHGLPELFDARVRKEKPSREMLLSILEDGVRWHASLLHSLVEHNERPGLAHARRMSDLEHTAWRRQQREACLVAQQALSRGRRLSMERDSKKRSYDEMSPTEQQLLEDFDVHRLQKKVDKTSMRVEKKAFRGSVLS